eukprot:Transcript_27579.p1 GENE.Transcript_27579~~Transcript_27579.p1  ORF type:complete len:243 (-),score=91.69 Transcript_27579:314-949(-)
MLRAALLACSLALAHSSDLGGAGSRQGLLQSRERRQRKLPPLAFQVGEDRYKVDLEMIKKTSRDGRIPTGLIMFHGRGDDYCERMYPLIKDLEDELGVQVKMFEVWHEPANTELLRKLDPARCGGVPYFYNKESHRWICGATTYDNLRAWGKGQPCDPFLPPPNINDRDDDDDDDTEKGGIGGLVAKLKKAAQEKMAERNGDAEDGGKKKK